MQTTRSPAKYSTTPTTNRETIETDLSNLRTRNSGFVRSESLRLTPPLDSKKDDVYHHKNRWRRRRRRECDNNGGNNLIEKFEAVIKTRVLELRLIGRRSWWPKPVWSKSKHINTSCHVINMHQKATPDNVNSNKTIVSKEQSMNIEGKQYTTKELIKRFDKCDSSSILVVQKQSKKKIKWKFWIPKEKRTMKSDQDDETTIVVDTRDDMDQIIDDTTTRDGPSKEGEEENLESIISRLEKELRQMRVGKDKGKKTKKRIVEIMAGATVSTLGVVVAIILL